MKFDNNYFMNYRLNSYQGLKVLRRIATGTTSVAAIYSKDLFKLKFLIPNFSEQQKIALFLTSIDTRIQQLEKKKTLLEQYKKGVMQKIFKQEARFRRDDGEEFSEWEERKLGDIGKTVNGLTGKTKDDFGIGKPYIQYKQIFDSSKINIEDCGLIDIKENENQNRVQYGDVFFTTSSETQNEIATASVLLDDVDEMYLNSFCFGLRVDKKLLSPSFAQFLFRSNSFRKKVFPLAQGSTRYNISKTNFLKLKVYLPSIEEQTKIAHFLTSLDKKIAVMEQQIAGMKEWKKGVLQRMFV